MTPLREQRKKRRLSGNEVAEAVGTDLSHYYKVERGISTASADLAERLSLFFGGAITELQILYPKRFVHDSPKKAS